MYLYISLSISLIQWFCVLSGEKTGDIMYFGIKTRQENNLIK